MNPRTRRAFSLLEGGEEVSLLKDLKHANIGTPQPGRGGGEVSLLHDRKHANLGKLYKYTTLS